MLDAGELYQLIVNKTREYEALMENKKKARAKTAHIKLRLYMEKNAITKDAMAKKLGISRMQLFRWLEERNMPGEEMMSKMEEIGIIEKEK